MKNLSTGEALAIIALLVFAAGWVAVMDGVWELSEDKTEDISSAASAIILAIWFGPPAWALWAVTSIVRGDAR